MGGVMKSIEEIRDELKETKTEPRPIAGFLPEFGGPSSGPVIPRMPGQVLPMIPSYPRAVGPDHDWGYNRVTNILIKCGCGSTSRDRIMHQITCPVWMARDLVFYPSRTPAPTSHMPLAASSEYPCTNWAATNCRIRGADRTKYCRNCLAAIGIYARKVDEHLGAVEDI
jgi:hypothetical protein